MPKNTDAERENRLMILDQHMEDLDFQGKEYSRQELLNYLKSKKFKISVTTLASDLKHLANNNQFIQNIGLNYSKYMEDISKKYKKIEREAWKIYNQKWTQSKQTKKQVVGRDNQLIDVIETITTKEIASPKIGALKVALESVKLQQELASGKNLNLSAAQWIVKTEELQEEIKRLNSLIPKEGVIKNDRSSTIS